MFKSVTPRVDFAQVERKLISRWYERGIVKKYLEKNRASQKKFSFIDGPITANNPMGVHHAWGRTYKDLWQRFFNMKGYKQRFQNGFDEQGLWVEVEVERELGLKTKKDIENLVPGRVFESIAKFVDLCKARVKKLSEVQTQQSKRLGYFMDWENSYHTSSDENNYAIWHYLKTVHEKGWLYKGRDSVPWCPRCGTAISQHEILTEEYQELTHKAVFVKYLVVDQDFSLLIWTTTPWTLPGNVSVAINPEFDYEVCELEGDRVLFANNAKKKVVEALGNKSRSLKSTKKTIKGSDLVKFKYRGPFDDLARVADAKKSNPNSFHNVVASEGLVTEDEGTGLVHIAPGAGEEDFKLSQEENLPVVELIDEEAVYLDRLGEFSGINAKAHPEIIIDYLKQKNYLFAQENYKHRYPICWRCKTELVWRVVDEWYIAMDKPESSKVKSTQSMRSEERQKSKLTEKTYREQMKEVIKDINWIPKWGHDRELDWLNNMHDWLISKKRYWGLALPIWECGKCGSFDVIGSKEELEKKAIEGLKDFEGNSPHRPWLDQVKIKCSKCGEASLRIADVGSPWLDAGIVPYSTLKYFEDRGYWKAWFPADFIVEAFPGQFKNWFYSLIAMSAGLENKAPFKNLLGHGMVKDEKGEEMHKSKGNAIEFNEAAEKIGVDVMRWLYLRTNPEHNVNFGFHVADEVRRGFHLRLWNVYAFFTTYAALDKWQPQKGIFKPNHVLDRWILSRLYRSIKNITQALDTPNFQANEAVALAEGFVVSDLSNWYVRRIRDRVGPIASKTDDKNDAYQTLWVVLKQYSKILAPMIPFITEEIYTALTEEESVHLADWPLVNEELIDQNLEKEMEKAREIVEVVHSIRKEKGIKVRQPLSLLTYKLTKKLDLQIEQILEDELNVKNVKFDSRQKEEVVLNTRLTQELKEEGQARELIRQIQEKRKEAGVDFDAAVTVYAPSWPKKFEGMIKRETLARELVCGERVAIGRR